MGQLRCVYGCPVRVIMTVWPHTHARTRTRYTRLSWACGLCLNSGTLIMPFSGMGKSVGLFPGGPPAGVSCHMCSFKMFEADFCKLLNRVKVHSGDSPDFCWGVQWRLEVRGAFSTCIIVRLSPPLLPLLFIPPLSATFVL